jgi:hypothetical protein
VGVRVKVGVMVPGDPVLVGVAVDVGVEVATREQAMTNIS